MIPLPTVGEVPLYQGDMQKDLLTVSRFGVAVSITGGLSSPSKMPCPGWGISASRCKVGSQLAEIEGTVCSICYARKRNYARDNVQKKMEERYQGLFHPLWTPAMAFLINHYCEDYFRMFDSGDVQGINHLKNICTMAEAVPHVRIWMPTREVETLQAVLRERVIPANLIPRVSANVIDGKPPKGFKYTSSVVTGQENASCPAQTQHNHCGDCRACWHDAHTSYPSH